MTAKLEMKLLGNPRAALDGEPVTGFVSRKAEALFYYLAATGQPHSRAALAGLLWRDEPDSRARRNLRDVLANLRPLLPRHIIATRQNIRFNQSARHTIDVVAFNELFLNVKTTDPLASTSQAVESLDKAVSLYAGEFMAGFFVGDAPSLESWKTSERDRLHELMAWALRRLADYYVRAAAYESGIDQLSRLLALDPWREAAHFQLMIAYSLNGQRGAALRQYELCRRALQTELAVEPAPETEQLYQQIRDGKPVNRPVSHITPDLLLKPASAPAAHHNIPHKSRPFIGRETELAQIANLLTGPNCRLLTLTGPGGIGKTQLALQAARQMGPMETEAKTNLFPHGIYFLPLAALTITDANKAPESLALTIIEALQLSFSSAEFPQEQLVAYFLQKDMLLILDNFEHLTTAVPLLVKILARAPKLKIMATSRVHLNMRDEQILELAGLPFPTADQEAAQPSHQKTYSAIQLFEQNAQLVQLDFAIAPADMPAVIRICQLIEGLPLGIELAASWTRLLSCPEIAHEIEASLRFLQSAAQDRPQRHQSLQAVFEHSWTLLGDADKQALSQLSIFRGGFTRKAAAHIAHTTPARLLSLLDNSLIRQVRTRTNTGLPARLELPEVVRQFAAEKLAETHTDQSDHEELNGRHCHYYLTLLGERLDDLRGERQQAALTEIGREIENVRRAWQWAISRQDSAAIGSAIASLFHFYDMQSWFQEGQKAFAAAAACLAEVYARENMRETAVFWGIALARQGWFTFQLGQQLAAKTLLEESLTILESLGAAAEMAFPLNYLAAATYYLGDYTEAQRLCQVGLSLCQDNGDEYGAAIAQNILSQIYYLLGRHQQARQYGEASLALGRKLGNRWHIAFSLTNLGTAVLGSGRYQAAAAFFAESLTIREAIGDKRGRAICLSHLGDTAQLAGNHDKAKQLFQSSLALFEAIGNQSGTADSLTKLGYIALAQAAPASGYNLFLKALPIAHRIRALPKLLDIIVGVAFARVETNPQQAAAIAAIVQDHPSATEKSRDWAVQLAETAARQFASGDGEIDATKAIRIELDTVIADLLGSEHEAVLNDMM